VVKLNDKFQPSDAVWIAQLERSVPERSGLRQIVTYDFPGKIAYYSSMNVLALDGLTSDLKFQHDLSSVGIKAYLEAHDIQVFVGPAVPISNLVYDEICDQMYLGSVKFACVTDAHGDIYPVGVDVFSRSPVKATGYLQLSRDQIIWSGRYTAWKIN
jgi:hypothetical protein